MPRQLPAVIKRYGGARKRRGRRRRTRAPPIAHAHRPSRTCAPPIVSGGCHDRDMDFFGAWNGRAPLARHAAARRAVATSRARATPAGAGARRRGWCRCRVPGRPRSRPAGAPKILVSTSSIRLANAFGSFRVLPDAPGEEAVAGEHMRVAVRVVVDQGDRARRVPDQMARGQLDAPDPDRVAVLDEDVGRHGDALGVVPARVRAGAGGRDDLGQRLPVVAVAVRGDDGGDAVVTDHAEQRVAASLAASISSCSPVARQRSR